MNPIANLPATQNLNRPQQSQGYNRQYFGGDEVDQFELSQEAEEAAAEEQKKKKIWAYAAGIGAAIVAGAAVLLGLRATGHATWAKLGNNENSLTGLTKLSKTQGDTVKKGATLAEGAMKGTLSGGSWNGISTSITGSASQYDNIIFIGKKENFDALKEKITDSAITNKLKHIACETWASLQKDKDFTDNIDQEKVAFIVDTDLRNADGGSVYEQIKKYWDEGNSAGGETKAEEKKEEETTSNTTTEAGKPEEGTTTTTTTKTDEARKPEEDGNTSVQQNPPTAQGAAAGGTPVVDEKPATTTATTTAISQAPIPEGSGKKLGSLKEKLDDLKQQLEKQNFGVVDEKGKPKDSMFVAIDEKVVEFNNKHDEMKPLVQQHEQKLKELVAEANNAQKRLAEIDSQLKELDKDDATETECDKYDELVNEKQKLEKVLASLTTDTDTDTDKPLKAKTGTGTEYESNSKYMPASLENYKAYTQDIMSSEEYSSIQPKSGTNPSVRGENSKNKSKLQAQQTALNLIKADLEAEVTILKQEAATKKQAAAAAKTKKEQAEAESQTATKDLETLSLSLNNKRSGVERYANLQQNFKSALSNLQRIQSANTITAITTATTAITTATQQETDDKTKAILAKANEALTKAKNALDLSNTQQPAMALSIIDTYIKDLGEALKSIPNDNTAKESINAAKESINAAKESILNSSEYKAYDAASKEWSEEKQNEYKQKQSEIKAEEAKIAEKQKVVDAAKTACEEAKKADEEAKKAEAKANGKIFDNSKTVSEMDVDNDSVVKKLENLKGKIDTCKSQLTKFTKSKPTA